MLLAALRVPILSVHSFEAKGGKQETMLFPRGAYLTGMYTLEKQLSALSCASIAQHRLDMCLLEASWLATL